VLFIEVLALYMNEQSTGRTGGSRAWATASSALRSTPCIRARETPGRWKSWRASRELEIGARGALPESRRQLADAISHAVADAARRKSAIAQQRPLSRIAEDVGYQTDTAFSRAFRREYGAPPAAWRRRQSNAPTGGARASRG
jgi:AraC-like DNA-binding protein